MGAEIESIEVKLIKGAATLATQPNRVRVYTCPIYHRGVSALAQASNPGSCVSASLGSHSSRTALLPRRLLYPRYSLEA